MSAELGLCDGGTVYKDLTTGDHPQIGGGLKGIISIVMGYLIVVVDEGMERFARLHLYEVFTFRKVDFGSGCGDPPAVVHSVWRQIIADGILGRVRIDKATRFFAAEESLAPSTYYSPLGRYEVNQMERLTISWSSRIFSIRLVHFGTMSGKDGTVWV